MQVDAEARRFDVIIGEALDRLSRKLADVADLRDGLTFLEVRLHAAKTDETTTVHAAQTERNMSSINAETIRCVRDAMNHRVVRQVSGTIPPHDHHGAAS